MRKFILLFTAVCTVFLTSCSGKNTEENKENNVTDNIYMSSGIQTDYDENWDTYDISTGIYNRAEFSQSYEYFKKYSTAVIQVRFNGITRESIQSINTEDYGEVITGGHHISEVYVEKVFEGDIEENVTINIMEPYYIAVDNDENKILVSEAGYLPMYKGKKYILFLRKERSGYYPLATGMESKITVPSENNLQTASELSNDAYNPPESYYALREKILEKYYYNQ